MCCQDSEGDFAQLSCEHTQQPLQPVKRSEVRDVMSAHTYTHLFKVTHPQLLGHDPHWHINNPIVACSNT